MKTKIISSFFIALSLIFFSGCGCKNNGPQRYPVRLEVWGLFDDRDAYNDIFENYKKLNPNVISIEYKKLTSDSYSYKKELLEALASGQGPDIFLVHNNWLPGFQDKIVSAPLEIINEQKFRKDFVDVAAADFISEGKIYAVPLSVDSLALYYNKNLFNEAGITSPPANWNEFGEDVKILTKTDGFGQITQSGAALGTASNINRSTDILSLIMLQNKTEMVSATGKRATFDKVLPSGGKNIFPGENALNFYTQFAKKTSSYYSWNPSMHYSVDAFGEDNLAMMFNYSWQIGTIRSKAPKLNFAVAPVPQIPGNPSVNYADYWAYAVAKNKISQNKTNNSKQAAVPNDARVAEAWKFLAFLATKPEQDINITANVAGNKKVVDPNFDPAKNYLEKTKKPAARRDLIEFQKTDPDLGVFVQGNLIAKSWYEIDPETIEGIFAQMIDQVNKGAATPQEAIKTAATQVTQLMNRK